MLAWLQILAAKNTDPAAPLVGVKEVCEAHWKEYGRNYYARYDYEGVDKPAADKMMADMVEAAPGIVGTELGGMKVAKADMFQYDDPVDGSVSKNQGVRVIFDDGSRFVFRLVCAVCFLDTQLRELSSLGCLFLQRRQGFLPQFEPRGVVLAT